MSKTDGRMPARYSVSVLNVPSSSSIFEADYLEIYDAEYSLDEDRFIAAGPSRLGVLVVVYTEHCDGMIRIVSARNATARETDRYWAYRRGEHE